MSLKFIIVCSSARSIWDKWIAHEFVPHAERFKEFVQKHNLTAVDPLPPPEPQKRTLPGSSEPPETVTEDSAKKVCDKLDPNLLIETAKITAAKVVDAKVPAGVGIKKDTVQISLRTDMPYSVFVSTPAEH